MTVRSMLAEKGNAVVTLRPDQTLAEAVETLARHRIGAVVVVGETARVAGILSERDIIRVLAKSGADSLRSPISEVMTSTVRTCTGSHTVDQVMEIMTRGRFRHVPVVDEAGLLIGIISIGDAVKRRIEEVEREAEQIKNYIATG